MKKIVLLLCLLAAPAFAADNADLIYRASLGRADDVKLLLDKGASPDQLDPNGVPILALAASRRDDEGIKVVETLLAAGANINATDRRKQSALFYAAKRGNADMVQLLLTRGIAYYAPDANNEIARTIAFKAGHTAIVTLMDNFVKAQTEAVNQQYEDQNRQAQSQWTSPNLKPELRTPTPPVAIDPNQPPSPAEQAALEAQALAEKRATPAYNNAMFALSYHACAYQYWAFCKSSRQSTDFSPDEIDVAIDSHREAIEVLTGVVMREYQLAQPFVATVANNAKVRIFTQLNDMPSKSYRREQNVGKLTDLEQRCQEVSNYWVQDQQTDTDGPQANPLHTLTPDSPLTSPY